LKTKLKQAKNFFKNVKLKKLKNQDTIIGYYDKFENNTFYGWVYNKESPSNKLMIEVFANGSLIASSLNNVYRQDLFNLNIGDGNHGFEISIPASYEEKFENKVSTWQITVNGSLILDTFSSPYLEINYNKVLQNYRSIIYPSFTLMTKTANEVI